MTARLAASRYVPSLVIFDVKSIFPTFEDVNKLFLSLLSLHTDQKLVQELVYFSQFRFTM